jgi:hypothetical protein
MSRTVLSRILLVLPLVCALTLGGTRSATAISEPLASSASVPWGDRLVREGISLQVAVEPLQGRSEGLRARDRVAFRFRISDVETGRPLAGLRPAAWMQPLAAGESVDPQACVREMEGAAGWELVRPPSLDRLDLGLSERQRPGTYEAVARLGRPGRYEVAFYSGAPRLVHCFEVEVRG